MPATVSSGTHPIAFDDKGNLYVSIGGSGNICVDPMPPRMPGRLSQTLSWPAGP